MLRGHWRRTGFMSKAATFNYLSQPRKYGPSDPPESGVIPLASVTRSIKQSMNQSIRNLTPHLPSCRLRRLSVSFLTERHLALMPYLQNCTSQEALFSPGNWQTSSNPCRSKGCHTPGLQGWPSTVHFYKKRGNRQSLTITGVYRCLP